MEGFLEAEGEKFLAGVPTLVPQRQHINTTFGMQWVQQVVYKEDILSCSDMFSLLLDPF